MDIILTLFSILFVGLLLATAFTFSLALIVIVSGLAIGTIAIVMLRDKLRRWSIMHPRQERPDTTVIEGQYTEITKKEE